MEKQRSPLVGLSKFHRAIKELKKLDPELPLQAAEVFILIALDEGATAGSVAQRMGIQLGTCSRYVASLGEYGRTRKLGLVTQTEVLGDRWYKELRLTPKGRLFRDSLLEIMGD